MNPMKNNKVLGIVFLCLLLSGVWLTYGVFTKKFTDYDEVELKTSKIGLQLPIARRRQDPRRPGRRGARLSRPTPTAPR